MLTPDELVEFIQNRMRMSHLYQPLLIRALTAAGGAATIRQLATSLLAEDESQIRYYEGRIKRMPLPVLKRHGIVRQEGTTVSLNTGAMDYQERAEVEMACAMKIGDFLRQRGLSTWDYRLLESDPVSTDVRYRVLAEAKGRCALCGATSKERRIEVDHIRPRSQGGTNEISNLQALCDECNRGKSNRDSTDFRPSA